MRSGAVPQLMSQVRLNPQASLGRALMAGEVRPHLRGRGLAMAPCWGPPPSPREGWDSNPLGSL